MFDSITSRTASAAFVLGALFAPVAFAQSANEDAKFKASDGATNDTFGRAVAIDGSYAVVGAPLDSHGGVASGSAYVFQKQGNNWVQVSKLVPSDGAQGDLFGVAVGISGDRLIVGADSDDDGGPTAGSAYVFLRQSNGSWQQEAKLVALDAATFDKFGTGVALEGTRAVVGAIGEDDGGSHAGAAYVFERSTSGFWQQKAKLVASDASLGDNFGRSIALDGDRVLISSHLDDDNAVDAGAAYIFERNSSGAWLEKAKLRVSANQNFDYTGYCVDLEGTRAVLGAYWYDQGFNNCGAAFVFERNSSGVWVEKAKLTASDRKDDDRFGYAVALSGNFVIAGAYGNAHNGFESGAAYLYERQSNGVWSQSTKIAPSDSAASDQYARFLDLDGHCAVIGSYLDDDNGASSGSVYVVDVGRLFHGAMKASITQAGSQTLLLRAGPDWANAAYLFLGSMTGTSGVALGGGVTLPLTVDGYTMIGVAGGLPIIGSSGLLNWNGSATATFKIPSGTSTIFAGTRLYHAYIAVDLTTGAYMASNAAPVDVVF